MKFVLFGLYAVLGLSKASSNFDDGKLQKNDPADEDCPVKEPGDFIDGFGSMNQIIRHSKRLNMRGDGTRINDDRPRCAELKLAEIKFNVPADGDCPVYEFGDKTLGSLPGGQIVRFRKAINMLANGTKIDDSLAKCASPEVSHIALGVTADEDCPDKTQFDLPLGRESSSLIKRFGRVINLRVDGTKEYSNVPRCAEIYFPNL